MQRIEVVGFGAMNLDLVYQVERMVADGEAMVEGQAAFPGGSAANTIYGLARLGVQAGFVGVVGDDDAGRMLLRDFEGVGVDTSRVVVKRGVASGSVLCLTDRLGQRALYVMPGANSLLHREDLALDYFNQARMVHLSPFVATEQFDLQKQVVANLSPSVRVSFAPGALYAARGLEALAPILARTEVLFLNREELGQLTGDDLAGGARRCLERGCRVAVVTMGGEGIACHIAEKGSEYTIEARQGIGEPMADTIGAGDAFAAGFIYGLLQDKPLEECGRLGDLVARFSIARLGARAGLPSGEELSRSYRELYGLTL